MDIVVQWATILSPICAVIIAVWTSKSSAKDVVKQIAALEENTNKQIKKIEELAKIQMEISMLQIDKDLWEARAHHHQISQRANDEEQHNHFFNQIGGFADSMRQMEYRKRDFSDNMDFYSNQINVLTNLQKQLAGMYKKVGGK